VITVVLVMLCGGAGAVARFACDSLVQRWLGGDFPAGTLFVNLSGSFLLGLVVGLGPSSQTTLLLDTATLGSYTTFSTWMLESHRPAEEGDAGMAARNLVVSVGTGLICVFLGRALGRTV
jgi:CrcB protein